MLIRRYVRLFSQEAILFVSFFQFTGTCIIILSVFTGTRTYIFKLT